MTARKDAVVLLNSAAFKTFLLHKLYRDVSQLYERV